MVMDAPFWYVARRPGPGADLPGGAAYRIGDGRDTHIIDP
jgi:hypothetical protein